MTHPLIKEIKQHQKTEEFQQYSKIRFEMKKSKKDEISFRNHFIENSFEESKRRFSKLLQSLKQISDVEDQQSYNNLLFTIIQFNDQFEKVQKIIEEDPNYQPQN